MNATLKSIQQLIYNPDNTLRLAAIRVLGAINSREPIIHKALADLMMETSNPEIFEAALSAVEMTPHEHILKQLVRVLGKVDADVQNRVIDAIARIGSKAVSALRQQFDKMPPETQHRMVRALTRIRSHPAHAFFIECLAHPDLQLMRDAVRSLRDEIEHYSVSDKADLFTQLTAALKDKRMRQNEMATSAIIISLGILGDIRAKQPLLSFVAPGSSAQIIHFALISLAQLPLDQARHADVAAALFPLLDDPEYDAIANKAVAVLALLPADRADEAALRPLLHSRHTSVQVFAMDKLASLDSQANAELIMEFLSASEQDLQEAALSALARMPSTINIVIKTIDEQPGSLRVQDLSRILPNHRGKISPDRARTRVRRMLDLRAKGDQRGFELNWEVLRQLKPEILQSEFLKLATAAFGKGDWQSAADSLGLLEQSDLLTNESRYTLMLASLKSSSKSRSRASRTADPALSQASMLLTADAKTFKKRLLAEKILTDEDYLYLGFHFSERLNEERRFGADILRYVVSRWPRRQSAKAAKQKLELEGH